MQDNTEMIDRDENWDICLFQEGQKIKELNLVLNPGLNPFKELQLL